MSLANDPAAPHVEQPAPPDSVEVCTPDAVEVTELNAPDPKALVLSRLESILFSAIVSVGLLVGVLVWAVIHATADVWLATGCLAALLFVAALNWLSLVWPKWDYDSSWWRLDDRGFEIRKGVFWRHQITVPAARVQHVDVTQGPLQRRYDLATLTIHTAGTRNESVSFEGLAHSVALELKDRLIVEKESPDVV